MLEHGQRDPQLCFKWRFHGRRISGLEAEKWEVLPSSVVASLCRVQDQRGHGSPIIF